VASPDRPTGQVAFLFTDIEGSTKLVAALGTAAWSPLLARHRRIIRAALAGHEGHEVATEGDGFFAVFRSALAAVLAAADAQRGLDAEPWPGDAPIRVRMGIHVGVGELDPDGSYVGHDVHRAARVASAAHGGQVLLSEPAAASVESRLPGGVGLRPLGPHRLKDLQPEHIAQLVVDGLSSDFPPIRSLDARPNNLPTQLTSFVGRERELAETAALLERTRLLTITGAGGTGKTRLSLQLAASVADRFPDGLWWIPLAAVRDPLLLLPTVTRTVGAPENVGRSPLDQLVDALAGRQVLIVLDNLEQLPGAAPILGEMLRALPRLHVLATSRSPLRVSGEQEYPLRGLPAPPVLERLGLLEREQLPAPLRSQDAAGLAGFEAVNLFVARGAAVKPGFALTDANAGDVASIVSHLDGIPLALELAAARLRFLTPAAIHERLERRLDLPGPGAMDVPERQRTLRGAIEWSHELLDERHRRLLERLAVFSGGFDLECVSTVAGGSEDPGLDLLDGLATLVDQSLLRATEADDEPRFSMLEPIREFALERLEASGDAERLRERHAGAYLALAERLEPLLSGNEQRRWLDKLELEHDNIRAALDWSEATGRPELALALAARCWRFWQKRGHLREARRRLERMLAQPWAAVPTPLRGDALEAAGGVAYWHGDFEGARPFYEEALGIRRATGTPADVANALYNLSFCFTVGGDATPESRRRGIETLTEALDLYHEAGDERGMANALWGIGIHHYFSNDNAAAVTPFEEALQMYRRVGDRTQEGWTMRQLGSALFKLGQIEQARSLLLDGLRLFDAAGDIAGVTMTLDRLSSVAFVDGDLLRAARLHGLARRLQQTSGADLARFVEESFEEATQSSVRATLAPAELDRYASEGAAMTLEEGVRYALTGDEPATRRPSGASSAASGSEEP
jgi:predicted ATPase/class 3 adenylate cyclase